MQRLGAQPPGFADFVHQVRPSFQWHRHCSVLADVLEGVASGKLRRVMVFMPPRHGKSELISRLFSAYYLRLHPAAHIGVCAYGASLAATLSRAARDNYLASGGAVRPDAAAASHWQTPAGGVFWSAGAGGPITGKGFHLGIIDDPIKNSEEAASETIREKLWEWYTSTFLTRQQPEGAGILLVQTRWHEDDLAGRILQQGDGGQPWHVVNLPALCEDPRTWPAGWTCEPDWRQPGEALSPSTFSEERLLSLRRQAGERVWAALYQQRPAPLEGGLFRRSWFTIVGAAPRAVRRIRYWDRAGTQDGGDYTAGVLMSRTEDGRFVIEDVVRGQWSAGERDRVMRQTAEIDGRSVSQWTEQEPGSSGKDAAASFVRLMAGFDARSETHRTNKAVRAAPLAAQAEAGSVLLLQGAWNAAFIEEMCLFPNGSHDDQADGASGAFNRLTDPPERSVYAPSFASAARKGDKRV